MAGKISVKQLKHFVAHKIMRWKHDAVAFVKEGLEVDELEDWQEEYLTALTKHDRISIRSGHGVGKSAALAWTILWYLVTHYPCKIACTAPSEHQLNDILWAEVSKWKDRLPTPIDTMFVINSDMIYMDGLRWVSFAVARVARKEKPEAFQGFHAEHMMFIGDEASGIEDIIFETAMGAMTTGITKIILTGNPTKTFGFFYNTFHRARDQYYTIHASTLDIKRKGSSPEEYAKLISSMYGESSNVYRIRVLGEFPIAGDKNVFPLYLLELAVDRKGVVKAYDFHPVWGLDVARSGSNRTALAKRCGNHLLEPVQAWSGLDNVEVAALLRDEYDDTPDEMKPAEIFVDTIGLGAGVYDIAKRNGLPVVGRPVSERPSVWKKGRRFFKLRDEIYWRAREWFEDRTCIIPDDAHLIKELSIIEYDYTGSDLLLKIEGKADIVKKLQDEYGSPDLADAFVLTFLGGKKLRSEPIEGPKKRYGDRYKRDRREHSGWGV
jgi:hypothetical protein